ncbi:MAG: pyruvate kinase [Rhodospirillaceae bacterium]|nr:pyruvate kinase [Rhodospirillaceae bacterium]
MRRLRSAKIVSTLGPSSDTEMVIRSLFETGVDIFRLNFSHGTHEEHKNRIDIIRNLERDYNHPVGIIADLQGPKIRVSKFKNNKILLVEGSKFILDSEKNILGDSSRVSISNPEIYPSLNIGTELLLDDGKLKLIVKKKSDNKLETVVLVGGYLSSNKGLNIPNTELPMSALTEKDLADIKFISTMEIDWVALSFVQRPQDIVEARQLIGDRVGILTKLEKPLAIKYLKEIITLSDAIMVARGDLGVEAPPEDVPGLQKKIIQSARIEGKPVIVATQMLESMISSPTPTRAEASDVATAVFDGADAVMLSAETAAGDYPIETVAIMNRIIMSVENDDHYKSVQNVEFVRTHVTDADAITVAAKQVAHTIDACAIVTFTKTGSTTLRAARERPDVPILGLTPDLRIARQMLLLWGVHPAQTSYFEDFPDVVESAIKVARQSEFAKKGDSLVITAGVPFGTPGATNVLRIVKVT